MAASSNYPIVFLLQIVGFRANGPLTRYIIKISLVLTFSELTEAWILQCKAESGESISGTPVFGVIVWTYVNVSFKNTFGVRNNYV